MDKYLEIINRILRNEMSISTEFTLKSRLVDLNIDSIEFMMLIVFIENSLDIVMDIDWMSEMPYENVTIQNVVEVIRKQYESKNV